MTSRYVSPLFLGRTIDADSAVDTADNSLAAGPHLNIRADIQATGLDPLADENLPAVDVDAPPPVSLSASFSGPLRVTMPNIPPAVLARLRGQTTPAPVQAHAGVSSGIIPPSKPSGASAAVLQCANWQYDSSSGNYQSDSGVSIARSDIEEAFGKFGTDELRRLVRWHPILDKWTQQLPGNAASQRAVMDALHNLLRDEPNLIEALVEEIYKVRGKKPGGSGGWDFITRMYQDIQNSNRPAPAPTPVWAPPPVAARPAVIPPAPVRPAVAAPAFSPAPAPSPSPSRPVVASPAPAPVATPASSAQANLLPLETLNNAEAKSTLAGAGVETSMGDLSLNGDFIYFLQDNLPDLDSLPLIIAGAEIDVNYQRYVNISANHADVELPGQVVALANNAPRVVRVVHALYVACPDSPELKKLASALVQQGHAQEGDFTNTFDKTVSPDFTQALNTVQGTYSIKQLALMLTRLPLDELELLDARTGPAFTALPQQTKEYTLRSALLEVLLKRDNESEILADKLLLMARALGKDPGPLVQIVSHTGVTPAARPVTAPATPAISAPIGAGSSAPPLGPVRVLPPANSGAGSFGGGASFSGSSPSTAASSLATAMKEWGVKLDRYGDIKLDGYRVLPDLLLEIVAGNADMLKTIVQNVSDMMERKYGGRHRLEHNIAWGGSFTTVVHGVLQQMESQNTVGWMLAVIHSLRLNPGHQSWTSLQIIVDDLQAAGKIP